jgi:hypothetical protein
MGGLTFFNIRYPQIGHFISGVTASCSAVTLAAQLAHSYSIPPAVFASSSFAVSSSLIGLSTEAVLFPRQVSDN